MSLDKIDQHIREINKQTKIIRSIDSLGSGNFLVDQFEADQDFLYKNQDKLECGCRKYCTCDSQWEGRE